MMMIRVTKRQQTGAALAIGLVVLLMLTILGVSNMNMTTLALKITGNTQNKNQAFQGAGAVLEQVFQAPKGSDYRINFASTDPQSHFPELVLDDTRAEADVRFISTNSGIRCPPGYTLGMNCPLFEITGQGRHTRSGARSVQVQGLYRQGIVER